MSGTYMTSQQKESNIQLHTVKDSCSCQELKNLGRELILVVKEVWFYMYWSEV